MCTRRSDAFAGRAAINTRLHRSPHRETVGARCGAPKHRASSRFDSSSLSVRRFDKIRIAAAAIENAANLALIDFLAHRLGIAKRFLNSRAFFSLAQPNTAAADSTFATIPNEFDAHVFKGLHHFYQRIDVAPYQATAALHSLDGRQGQFCALRKEQLVDAQQGTGSTKL